MGFRLPKTKGMLRRDAANWLARLQSGRDPEIECKFGRWRNADPRHAAAFDSVRRSFDQAGLLRHSTMLGSQRPEQAVRTREWQPRPAFAAAAAIAVLVTVAVVVLRDGSPAFAGTLVTRVGEIRQVKLADGSKVTLDTATKLEVEIGRYGRHAHLRYGRARFQIVEAGQPFVVDTANSTITSRDGVIDVEQGDRRDLVRVLAGAADVRGPLQSPRLELAAGEGVSVKAAGGEQKSVVPPGADWTRGMLQFDGTPLADAVSLANRYSERQIILTGNLDGLRVTGAFRAGDAIGLAKALGAAFHLTFEQNADGNFVLRRAAAASKNKKGG